MKAEIAGRTGTLLLTLDSMVSRWGWVRVTQLKDKNAGPDKFRIPPELEVSFRKGGATEASVLLGKPAEWGESSGLKSGNVAKPKRPNDAFSTQTAQSYGPYSGYINKPGVGVFDDVAVVTCADYCALPGGKVSSQVLRTVGMPDGQPIPGFDDVQWDELWDVVEGGKGGGAASSPSPVAFLQEQERYNKPAAMLELQAQTALVARDEGKAEEPTGPHWQAVVFAAGADGQAYIFANNPNHQSQHIQLEWAVAMVEGGDCTGAAMGVKPPCNYMWWDGNRVNIPHGKTSMCEPWPKDYNGKIVRNDWPSKLPGYDMFKMLSGCDMQGLGPECQQCPPEPEGAGEGADNGSANNGDGTGEGEDDTPPDDDDLPKKRKQEENSEQQQDDIIEQQQPKPEPDGEKPHCQGADCIGDSIENGKVKDGALDRKESAFQQANQQNYKQTDLGRRLDRLTDALERKEVNPFDLERTSPFNL